jgi:dipeptidase
MPCTTILVGKKASYDGSTLIARNDDSPTGIFCAKKLVLVESKDQPRHYKSVIAHLAIELPDNPLRYTCMPSVDKKEGIWGAAGINEANVAMTATETITTNERVLGADPMVSYEPRKGGIKEKAGGIGEEDLVVITLPYIHSAREGVLRLGGLLEKYGTYESNGIAFSDKDEIWWLESIGGHHWIAKRVPDDSYVTMPNQFGLDNFDFADAYGAKKDNLCSPDLKEFVTTNHLALDLAEKFNPRLAFGSHSDSDHVYNTPRAWYIERYFNPRTHVWDGENADFTPLSDDIPWANVPERKITVRDVKYILSSHFQGTPYDPYARFGDATNKGAYRPIGISRTSFLSVAQIRGYAPKEIAAIEWFTFASNPFNELVPFFTNSHKVPSYYGKTTLDCDSNNFYWANRLLGAMADSHFTFSSAIIERYQDALANKGYEFVNKVDASFASNSSISLDPFNQEMADTTKKITQKALNALVYEVSCHMKNGYAKSDN